MKIPQKFNLWERYKKSLDLERRFRNATNLIERRNRAQFLTNLTLTSTRPGISSGKIADKEVIVSLTTYGVRFYEVYLAIESLMQQTVKPNKIVLWLDYSLQDEPLPVLLQNQVARGLEIRYCEDLKSYKKLVPSLESYPDSVIITADDDIMYSVDMIEKLVNAYNRDNSKIYCNRMHRITFRDDGSIDKYVNWEFECDSLEPSKLVFPTGCAGCLYPPKSLSLEVLNKEVFMSICPYADDVWFKCMSLLNGTLCQKVFTHNKGGNDFIASEFSLDNGLYNLNVGQSKNDEQIKAVFDKYNLYSLIR